MPYDVPAAPGHIGRRSTMRRMPEFRYADLLPLGEDTTEYRQLTVDGISARSAFGRDFIEVEPDALTLLTATAMRDIAHLLRPGHLRQLRSILDDPEASAERPVRRRATC